MGQTMSAGPDSNEIYWRIIEFLEQQLGVDRRSLHSGTRLGQDLGVDGDDADELMQAYADQFNVDLDGFIFDRHFGPEAANPLMLLAFFLGFLFLKRLIAKEDPPPPMIAITINDLVRAAEAGRWIEPESGDTKQ